MCLATHMVTGSAQ
ncbi:rCG51049, partial [Rattus norvegicus]